MEMMMTEVVLTLGLQHYSPSSLSSRRNQTVRGQARLTTQITCSLWMIS
uniref:Uncharacterized protein n=1 Tax=Rhizophora mucronata TaxID=61149 RepID=A0A2P2PP60_RHIMU